MATQEGINDTRPREAISALIDETTAGNVASPADRQVLEKGSAGKKDSRPETTHFSIRAAIAQFLVAGAVLLLTTCCGIDVGHSAVLLPQLKAENSTLPTDEELGSWIASVQAIASAFGIFLGGLLMERWGRRRAIVLCSSVSFTAGWIILAFATNHATVLTARIMAGFSSGLTVWLTQMTVDETSEPRISAMLTATKFLCHSSGILLVYILGTVMKWNTVSGVIAAFPLLSLVAFVLLPESSVWLAKNTGKQEAEKTLWWLRGRVAGIQAKRELEHLTSQDGSRDHESLTRNPATTLTRRCCQDVSKPHILKPLIIVSVFYFIQIISGTYLLIFHAVDLITHADTGVGLGLDRFLAAIVTAAVRLLFAVATCFILRSFGRRPLLLTVGALQTIAALSAGMFLYAKNGISTTDYELPACKPLIVASILAYVATNTCTYFAMPDIAMAELLPDKIRGYACMYILAGTNVAVFVTTKFFPWLCNLLGVHGVFGLFGATTAIGTIVMYLLLPESIGMSLVQVENYFRQPNTMWVGRNMRLSRGESEPNTEYHEMRVRS